MGNKLLLRGQAVKCTDAQTALLDFVEFLRQIDRPVLVGHNAMSFDIPVLYNNLKLHGLVAELSSVIAGCADTLRIVRRAFPKQEGGYSQSNLVGKLLGATYGAHDAQEDTRTLKELYGLKLASHKNNSDLFPLNYNHSMKSLGELISTKAIGQSTAASRSKCGVTFRCIKKAHERDPTNGLRLYLWSICKRQTLIKIANHFISC